MSYLSKIFISFFVYIFVLAESAYAYLDPGTGSMLLQALAAGFLAIGVFWRGIMKAIKKLWSRKGAK